MKKRGFSIFPVDHEFNSHKTAVATISLNLQDIKNQKLVEDMLLQVKPAAIHLGLPCGTCSRARERPLPQHLKDQFSDPPPLRDAQHLLGFPHLTGTQATKVQTANDLYKWGVKLLYICFLHNIKVSIENPERSWLWGVLALLVRQYEDPAFLEWYEQLDRVTFHMCMHGGKRAKNTRLLASRGLYTALAGQCDGQHEHEPWRITKVGTSLQYDTATEAEYPVLFCKRMADLLAESVQLPQPPCSSTNTRTSRRILGHHTKQAEMDAEPTQANHRCLASQLQGQTTEMEESTETSRTETHQQQGKKHRKMFRVGVQQEPQDFLRAAMNVPHPMSPQTVLPATLKAALFDGYFCLQTTLSLRSTKQGSIEPGLYIYICN